MLRVNRNGCAADRNSGIVPGYWIDFGESDLGVAGKE
jgi:hypothetical protein